MRLHQMIRALDSSDFDVLYEQLVEDGNYEYGVVEQVGQDDLVLRLLVLDALADYLESDLHGHVTDETDSALLDVQEEVRAALLREAREVAEEIVAKRSEAEGSA